MKQSVTSELNFPLTIRAIGNLLTIQVTPLKGPSWADMMDEEDEEIERMHDQPATTTPSKGPSPADEMDEENGKGVLPEFGPGKEVTAAQRDLQKTYIVPAADSSMKKPKVTIQHRTNWKNQKSCGAKAKPAAQAAPSQSTSAVGTNGTVYQRGSREKFVKPESPGLQTALSQSTIATGPLIISDQEGDSGEDAKYETPEIHIASSQSTTSTLSTGAQGGCREGVAQSVSPASQTAPLHSTSDTTDLQAIIEGFAQLEFLISDDSSYYTASEAYFTPLGSPMRSPPATDYGTERVEDIDAMVRGMLTQSFKPDEKCYDSARDGHFGMWVGKKLGDSKNVTKREKEERRVAPKAPRTVPLVAVPKLEHILKKRCSQIQPPRS
ncbi:hypothetical protein F5882DRAFT_466721 [Hyaloscypha sp. PMI_1271]|nr:hypothetical protein F5882DRAFT_466721 [Hyaloscypha sp. PMI_1271]